MSVVCVIMLSVVCEVSKWKIYWDFVGTEGVVRNREVFFYKKFCSTTIIVTFLTCNTGGRLKGGSVTYFSV